MSKGPDFEVARVAAGAMLRRAGIVLTEDEFRRIEVTDFGLGELSATGIEALIYVNTDRVCAKELVLLPRQTCPEHAHDVVRGKEETFRCRWGEAYLCVPGDPAAHPLAVAPAGREAAYTVRHEIVLRPGDQYTVAPGTRHWFQAGVEGAVISEFFLGPTTSQMYGPILTSAGLNHPGMQIE